MSCCLHHAAAAVCVHSGVPLTTFTPGYISKDVIYSNGTKPGWNW
jgi:hypothetical protein